MVNVRWAIEVDGVEIDPCRVALPVTVTMGRSSFNYQPDAPTCQFTWLGGNPPFKLGSELRVFAYVDNGSAAKWTDPNVTWTDSRYSWFAQYTKYTRFTGEVMNVTATQEDLAIKSYTIEAVGTQAKLGSKFIRISRPKETEVQRIAAIAAAAGMVINIKGGQALEMNLRADNIERDALAAIHEVCTSTGSILWQDVDGSLWYGLSDFRASKPKFVLPCDVIRDDITWKDSLDLMVNSITIEYGNNPDNLLRITQEDADSIAEWQKRSNSISTLLDNQSDAEVAAEIILRRRAQPFWINSDVVFLVSENGSLGQYTQVCNFQLSDGVLAPIASEPEVTSEMFQWSIEGWVETYDVDHYIQYALSDRQRFGAYGLRNWDEVRQMGDWGFWAPSTYSEMLVKEIGVL